MSEYFEQLEQELGAAVRRGDHLPRRRLMGLRRAASPRRAAGLGRGAAGLGRGAAGLGRGAAGLGHAAATQPHAVERRIRRASLHAAMAVATVGAVAAAILAFAGHGGSAQPALAGWSAAPTTPASGQTQRAESGCVQMLREGGRPALPGISRASGWQVMVTDTRGPYTLIALESADGTANARCLFNGTGAHLIGFGSGFKPVRPSSVPTGQIAVNVPLTQSGVKPPKGPERRRSDVLGVTAMDVTGVVLDLSDGTKVTASLGHDHFMAWWPGWQKVVSVEVKTSSGTHIQQLPKATSIG